MPLLFRHGACLAGVLLLAWAGHVRADCQRVVLTADPGYPPLHWYDGHALRGASIEIAKRVLSDLGIPYEVRYVGPLARVMAMAQHGDVDMVTTLKKTPEREAFLLYPKTAAMANPVAVFAMRNHEFEFREWRDLVGLKGGITRGNLFGGGFDDYLRQKLTSEEAPTVEINFKKLSLGRLDYVVTGYYTGMAHLLQRGDEERFMALTPFVADAPNFITLTRNGRCADKLAQIDAHLAVLKKGGVVDDLIRDAFKAWKAQPVMSQP